MAKSPIGNVVCVYWDPSVFLMVIRTKAFCMQTKIPAGNLFVLSSIVLSILKAIIAL